MASAWTAKVARKTKRSKTARAPILSPHAAATRISVFGYLRVCVRALMLALAGARPENFKGTFLVSVYISCTHGPALPLSMAVVDPGNLGFMGSWNGVPQHLEGGAAKVAATEGSDGAGHPAAASAAAAVAAATAGASSGGAPALQ